MGIVIDTTMIFSLLLGKNFKMRDTFFDSQNKFFSPNYVVVEAFEKKEKIMRYSVLSEVELYELLYRMFEKITFVNENLVSSENKQKAYQLCKDVDEDDTPIVALALQLGAPVWTGDEKLKKGLRAKGFNFFFEPSWYDIPTQSDKCDY
jgi:predicted nucleic acid-binding protein